jgi:hypothetical protein
MRLPAAALACLAVLAPAPVPPAGAPGESPDGTGRWSVLEPGLELGVFPAPRASRHGDSLIRVLRIDPRRYELRLLNASAPGQGEALTAREWSRRNGLVAAINASMYQTDMRKSVSLMRSRTHVNNPHLTKDKAVLAFDRLDPGLPPVQIIDRECQDFDSLRDGYGTLVQSIRMVSCSGKNVWSPQPRAWSTAAIGMDRKGRVLFLHARSPYSTHDFINILLELPIDLKSALYAEGGPEAQLYARTGGQEFEFIGSYETGFRESDDNRRARPVPNVIGVAPLEAARR